MIMARSPGAKMTDKYFASAKDRLDLHSHRIEDNLKYLEFLAYDHREHLPYTFQVEIDKMRSGLRRMQEILEEAEQRSEGN